jgi:hypothetical protein
MSLPQNISSGYPEPEAGVPGASGRSGIVCRVPDAKPSAGPYPTLTCIGPTRLP